MVELVAVVPPLSGAEPLTSNQWDQIEGSLGTLPADFRQLADTYGGGGAFFDELWIPSVRPDSNGTSAFVEFVHSTLDGLSDAAEAVLSRSDDTIEPLWPADGGLLPWGSLHSGGYVCWRTTGDPDQWSCALVTFDGNPPATIDCGATDFLLRWRVEDLPTEVLERLAPLDGDRSSKFLPDTRGYLGAYFFAAPPVPLEERLGLVEQVLGTSERFDPWDGLGEPFYQLRGNATEFSCRVTYSAREPGDRMEVSSLGPSADVQSILDMLQDTLGVPWSKLE